MHDLYGTTKEGLLGPDGFCMYRAAIESHFPLEQDLLKVGIDVLPRALAQWEKNKLCFDRMDGEHPEESQRGEPVLGTRARARTPCRRTPSPPPPPPFPALGRRSSAAERDARAGRVPVGQLQQLVADCGEILTGEQVPCARSEARARAGAPARD